MEHIILRETLDGGKYWTGSVAIKALEQSVLGTRIDIPKDTKGRQVDHL